MLFSKIKGKCTLRALDFRKFFLPIPFRKRNHPRKEKKMGNLEHQEIMDMIFEYGKLCWETVEFYQMEQAEKGMEASRKKDHLYAEIYLKLFELNKEGR